jgi:integrase
MLTSEWLELWFNVYATNSVRTNTLEGYRRIVYKHLIPGLGNIPLEELKGLHIRQYINNKAAEGSIKDGGKHHLAIIKMALDQAMIDEEIAKNPADKVKLLKREKKEYIPWTKEEAELFLEKIKETRFYPLYLLAWVTGMRRSELLGLQWQDIDLNNNQLHVRRSLVKVEGGHEIQEPKTKLSRRTITLPEKVMKVLENQKNAQLHESKKKIDYNPSGFVFCNSSGRPYYPDYVSHRFKQDVKSAGLRQVRFYDFRHGHATFLIELGEDIKVIADRLGHSTIMLTGDTYTHIQQSIQQKVAKNLNDHLDI